MQLLHTLWFFVAQFQIFLFIEHIPGMHNEAADMKSKKTSQFFTSYPQELLLIVPTATPDWTSPTFTQLFSTITNKV